MGIAVVEFEGLSAGVNKIIKTMCAGNGIWQFCCQKASLQTYFLILPYQLLLI